MLKKLIYVATAVAILISACACGDAQTEQREYDAVAVFHADTKASGGLLFAEDAHYEVGSEWGVLDDSRWYVVTLDNNGTSDKSDDTIIGLVALQ